MFVAEDAAPDAGVIFVHGKAKMHLRWSSDGWWEESPDSGLRLCRQGGNLVLQRRSSKKKVKQNRAAKTRCAAACLCYQSTLQSFFMKDKPFVAVPSPSTVAETVPPPLPQPESPDQFVVEDDELWPEPEAEGLPEQPSTAHDQNPVALMMNFDGDTAEMPSMNCDGEEQMYVSSNGDELPEAASGEKLILHPQVISSWHGVTANNGQSSAPGSVIALGAFTPPRGQSPDLVVEMMGTPFGGSPGTPLGESPRSPEDEWDTLDVDLQIRVEEPPKPDRVVVEVSELSTTIHGLLSVPEGAELPDVPSPIAPSRSDSALLHGSVHFDGDLTTWLREHHEIPDEETPGISSLPQASAWPRDSTEELGRSVGMGEPSNVDLHGEREPLEAQPAQPYPRPSNPLVRSQQVSSNLSRSEALRQMSTSQI